MLSFGNKLNNLSGLKSKRLPHLTIMSKESIFRPLLFRGSLAVETALVLPLFLFFIMTLLSVLNLMSFNMKLQQLLYQEGIILSEESFDKGNCEISKIEKDICEALSSSSDRIPVEGGLYGLDFSESNLDNPELTEIAVVYTAKLNFDYFNLFRRRFCQNVTFHNWVGYINGLSGNSKEYDEEYVYITEDSEVYHKNRDCTHIRLSIVEVSGSDIGNLRNNYGDKYVPCSHCKAKRGDKTLYITREGNCYHNSLECSGLSRSVTAVPLSKVGSRRPCMRCGY